MAQLKDTLITGNLSVTGTGNIGGDTQVSGDLTLYESGTGDSPALVFQRGTLTDNYNDWRLIDVGGQLKFQERGLNSTDWTNRVSMSSAGDITATTFTGSGANLTGVVTSVTASGILSSSGGTTPAITHNAPSTSPAKSTSAVYPITIDSYGHITAAGTAVTIPTVTSSYSSTGTDAVNGTAVNAALQTLDSSISSTTGQAISAITITDGKIASSSKISVGDANQNAFSNIKVDSTTIAADSTTDTLELVAGTDITLTPDATNDKVTIAFSGSPEVFRVIATYQSGTDEWTLDKTFSEISAAYESGAFVYIQQGEDIPANYPVKIYPATSHGDDQGNEYIKFEGWDQDFYLRIWTVYEDDTVVSGDASFAAETHSHGYITSDGDITSSATIASGDRLVINDESSSRIINSSITFGTSTTTFLANNGTWQTPAGGSSYTATSPISISNDVISHSDSGVNAGGYTKVTVDSKGHATNGVFEYNLYPSSSIGQLTYQDIEGDVGNSVPPLISHDGQIYNYDWDDQPESEMHFSHFGYDYSGVPTLYSFYIEDGVSGIQSYSTTRLARYSELSDTKVTQTVRSNNADYPVLLAPSGQTATTTTTANFATSLKYNPSTDTLYAGTFNGNATSATSATSATTATNANNIKLTTTNPTSGTTYYLPFTTGITSSTNYAANGNNGIRYMTLEGTTSAAGYGRLILGNATATGTAANKTGWLRIYGDTAYYMDIKGGSVTANRTVYLPTLTATGYLLGKSSTSAIGASNQLVYFSAAGVASAGIKISGGTSDPSGGSSGDIYIKIPS